MGFKKVFNKKGSVTVFLASILLTMIMASMVFVHAARSVSCSAYADAVLELAGRSALAEFDRRLKDEYGIFAFYGRDDIVKAGIKFYASASFDKKLPGEIKWGKMAVTDLFRLKLESLSADLSEFSLMDANVFEKQIEAYMNFMIAQKGFEYARDLWMSPEKEEKSGDSTERTLKSQAEIKSLPSGGNASGFLDILAIAGGGLPQLDSILDKSALLVKVNEYILSHFKYGVGGDKEKDTFFKNEVEYILYGRMGDIDNMSKFRSDFVLLRTVLNEIHIASCPDKRTAVLNMSKAFRHLAPAAAVVIATAWSIAEAENDARLLFDGKKVALYKTDDNWALDLENAVRAFGIYDDDDDELTDVTASPKTRSGYITPSSDSGLAYADYLRIFLYFEKRETKLLRVMDLIQLNLRGSYYDEFLIKDHYTGFRLDAIVSGKMYSYEQKY